MALFTSACSVLGVEKPDSKENALEAIKALSTLKGCIIFAANEPTVQLKPLRMMPPSIITFASEFCSRKVAIAISFVMTVSPCLEGSNFANSRVVVPVSNAIVSLFSISCIAYSAIFFFSSLF